jgi:type IV pilus assembly protein PilM
MGLFRSGGEDKRAGLFIFGGTMQYVELSKSDSGYTLEKCIDMPYDIGSAGGDLFVSQEIVESNLRSLKRAVGKKWPVHVYAGIQSKDVLLRTVELPQMGLRDIKDAFRYEFDRFFPIPVEDSIYDVSFVDRPAQDDTTGGAVAFCLAAAVKRAAIENFMFAVQRVGLKLSAIEPSPVAMLRCLTGPVPPFGYNVYALAGLVSSIIVAAYKDNGIVYRNTTQSFATVSPDDRTVQSFTRDLQATVNFAATQMRGFTPDKVYIGGYGAALGERIRSSLKEVVTAPINFVNPWRLWSIKGSPKETYGWEVSLGLALRPTEVK